MFFIEFGKDFGLRQGSIIIPVLSVYGRIIGSVTEQIF